MWLQKTLNPGKANITFNVYIQESEGLVTTIPTHPHSIYLDYTLMWSAALL